MKRDLGGMDHHQGVSRPHLFPGGRKVLNPLPPDRHDGGEEGGAASTDAAAAKRTKGDRMARIDLDGDGRITAAEFAAPAMQRFDKMDANSDGIVTPDERKAARAARRAARG